jgi:hypothetical protein
MANPAIAIQELSLEERVKTGCSHRAIVDYTDLTDTAGTAKTLVLLPYVARDIFNFAMFDLVTPFDGTSTTSLTMWVGHNGASVDDADSLIRSVELHNDATEILAGCGNGEPVATDTVDETYSTAESTVLASCRTQINAINVRRFAAQEAGNIEAVFTSTSANLTDLLTGKVFIYLNRIRLSDSHLRPLSA